MHATEVFPDGHISSDETAALLSISPTTLRVRRNRGMFVEELPFHRSESGRISYALSDVEKYLSESGKGEMLDPEEGEAVFSDVPNLGDELAKIQRRRRLKTASRMLRRAAEILGDPSLELHLGADLTAETKDASYGEFFTRNVDGARDLIASAAHWLWEFGTPPNANAEPGLTDPPAA